MTRNPSPTCPWTPTTRLPRSSAPAARSTCPPPTSTAVATRPPGRSPAASDGSPGPSCLWCRPAARWGPGWPGSSTRWRFSPDERAVLSTVARMLAQALARAGVAEQRERELSLGLQCLMMPTLGPEIPGMTVAARYVPTGGGLQVGGDWYDMIPLPNGRIALVIGDVQGHDVRAAWPDGPAPHRSARLRVRGAPPGRRARPGLPLPVRAHRRVRERRGRRGTRGAALRDLPVRRGRPGGRDPGHRPRGPPRPGGDQRRRDRGDPADRRRAPARDRDGLRLPHHPGGPGIRRDDHAVHGRPHRDGRARHGHRLVPAAPGPGEAGRGPGTARRLAGPGRPRADLALHDRAARGPAGGRHRGPGAAARECPGPGDAAPPQRL
ncbi:hypothetical protein SBADM41S_03831 [Streptomyces badius]